MIPLASSTTKYRDGILKSQHFARPFKSSQETKGKFKSQGILFLQPGHEEGGNITEISRGIL